MDRFEEMKTFVAIVKNGSLSAAADKLNIAKSAISRRIADLEERLGVQLLNRTTRRIYLTETGEQFYRQCLHLLSDLEEMEQAISNEHAELRGTIRVAAPLSFGIKHLSPVLNDFLKEHSNLSLDLNLNDRMINLMEESVDLAIRIGQLEDSSFKARCLAPMRSIICASPEYLERYGVPERAEDLKRHTGLSYSNVADGQKWQLMDPQGSLITVRVPHRMRVNNGDVLLKAAIDGLGIVAMPTFIAYEAVNQGLLIPVLENYKLPDIAVYAIYPDQRHLSRRIRLLIDYLVNRFGDKPYWDA